MKKFLVLTAIVVGLLSAGDFLVRQSVESRAADAARDRLPGVGSVTTDIGSFPFVPRLLLTGDVTKFVLNIEDVRRDPLPLARLRVDVRDISISRDSLVKADQIHIKDVGSATITAAIDLETLQSFAETLGLTVTLDNGVLNLSALGTTAAATVKIDNGAVVVAAGTLPLLVLPLPNQDLMPCSITAVVGIAGVELSCTTDHLPQVVIDAVARVDAGG